MNKQGNKSNPRGGIEWCHIYGPGTGYTSNPVKGCMHECQWRMPDGEIAQCYAKSVALRLNQKAYPHGFEHISYNDDELVAWKLRKEPSGIFVDSMSDLFGQKVEKEKIDNVIKAIEKCPQHIFFSLTKNPSRFREFLTDPLERGYWPKNWFVGISSPPTFMYGKELTVDQQRAWFRKSLEFLCASPAQVRWVSIEPLTIDLSDILAEFKDRLHWAVIGAASNGAKTYQPDADVLQNTLIALAGIPVFFKGNLDKNLVASVGSEWREEWPGVKRCGVCKAPIHKDATDCRACGSTDCED